MIFFAKVKNTALAGLYLGRKGTPMAENIAVINKTDNSVKIKKKNNDN